VLRLDSNSNGLAGDRQDCTIKASKKRPRRRRLHNISLRIGLFLGLAVTVLFYLLLLSRTTMVQVMYVRYEPLLQSIFIHDCFTVLLMCYWIYLILYIHRVKNPLIPFLIFFLHAVISPYLLMGDNAVFLRFRRFGAFRAGYPIALGTISIWVLAWLVGNRSTIVDRARKILLRRHAWLKSL